MRGQDHLNITLADGSKKRNLLRSNLEQIARLNEERSSETFISSGELETVLKKANHRSRKALVWKNLFFNTSKRKTAKYERFFSGGNAPLFLHPELVHVVEHYVILSNRLLKIGA